MAIAVVLVLCVIVFEIAYFLSFDIKDKNKLSTDCIIYFAGEPEIKKKAYELFNQNYSNYIVETGSIKNSKTNPQVIFCQSKSTFEDAFMISEFIKTKSFNSIFVIAADYHMARSYFFLKIALINNDITTHFSQVPVYSNNWFEVIQKKNGIKLLYNEIIKLNTGFIELIYKMCTDSYISESKNILIIKDKIKEYLLFEINN